MRHLDLPKAWNETTDRIIGAAIEVHRALGPGLLERLYEDAMAYELNSLGMRVSRQYVVCVPYKDTFLGELRLDLVVDDLVVIELKCIERVVDVHAAQLVSYLRSADLPIGLIINFFHPVLVDGLTRRINPHCSRLSSSPPAGLSPRISALSDSSAFITPPRSNP